jgi:hypothetical protein
MSEPPTAMPAELHTGLPPDFALPDPATGYYPESDLSGGLPINLDSLRDGPPGSKPFYPYSTLIRCVMVCLDGYMQPLMDCGPDTRSRDRRLGSSSLKISTTPSSHGYAGVFLFVGSEYLNISYSFHTFEAHHQAGRSVARHPRRTPSTELMDPLRTRSGTTSR